MKFFLNAGMRVLLCAFIFSLTHTLVAQGQSSPKNIAVLRMRNINPTAENTGLLADFGAKLNTALGATNDFVVPGADAILEAIDDEGVEPDKDLIDLDDYLDVGKSLETDYIVIGSVLQKTATFYGYARIYSVADGSLQATTSSQFGMERVSDLVDLLAHHLNEAMERPVKLDSAYSSFEWSQEFRLLFGDERLDLAPPVVHFVNENPPFEIGVRISMDRLNGRGSFVVTNFDIYVDDESIAAISYERQPPYLLREEEVTINGHTFCFQVDLKELRGAIGRPFVAAFLTISAKSCQ